jgi:hypothetical protein
MSPDLRRRISLLIARLDSDYDGEVVAAARSIRRTLAANGYSLHDLVLLIGGELSSGGASYRTMKWAEMVQAILEAGWCRNPSELDFVSTLERYAEAGKEPTEKQLRWLTLIYTRGGAKYAS